MEPQAASDIVTPLLYVFGLGLIILESAIIAWKHIPRDGRSRWLSIKCAIVSFGIEGVLQATVFFAVQMWFYQHRFFELDFSWWVWLLCLVINDLMYYISHRIQHRVRLLWAVHVVHHSPRHYDLATGIRGSLFGGFTAFPFVAWIPLLGIHPLLFLVTDKLFKFYGLAYHSNAIDKLGWLDKVLITPSVHRVHHATNSQYIDRNYGGLLLCFDQCFRSYEPEVEPPSFGLVKDWHGYGLVDCQFHEFRDLWRDMRSAATWREALQYMCMPPGWTPTAGSIQPRSGTAVQ